MDNLYDAVGGAAVFRAIVDRFYDGVAVDPILRPLYPEEDLTAARERLAGFLHVPGTFDGLAGPALPMAGGLVGALPIVAVRRRRRHRL